MRTTLSIEDDVLAAAKELAAREGKTVGQVISSLAREALRPKSRSKARRNGVPLLPVRPGVSRVTPELVNQLRDELI
jgi:hypothetical protein